MTAETMRAPCRCSTAVMDRRYRLASAAWKAALFVLAAGVCRGAPPPPRNLLLDGARAGDQVVAVGERGAIVRFDEHGRGWTEVPRVVPATLTGISFASGPVTSVAQRGWAVGHDASILATTDGGRRWSKQYQGDNLQDSFLDVLALTPEHVIAIGGYGLFVETRDGGKTWASRAISKDDFHLNRVTRGATGTLYLAGEHGTLLRSRDAAATWEDIRTPYTGSFYGILPLDRQTLLAYGLRGHVFRSVDDGATWSAIPTPQPVLLASAVKLKSDLILLAGYAGTLLISRDDGKSFSALDSPTKAIAELIELPDGNVLALGEAGAAVIAAPK